MNALVISGGGSKGAFAGGVAEFLIKTCRRDYQLLAGTSTGSLLVPLLSVGKIERLKEIYTTVTQKDIFSISPFLIRKEKEEYRLKMNHLGIIKMFLQGKKTFGDSSNLKKLIKRIFTIRDYEELRYNGKEVVVTVANLTTDTVEYKSSKEWGYDDFCEWIWASANLLPFMSLMVKDGCEYGDGGFGNLVPVQRAINLGATSVDVIVLRPVQQVVKTPPSHNAFNLLTRTYDFMLNQIGNDDLVIGQLEAAHRKVEVHFFHTPRILTEQSFIFDPVQMKAWWEEGYLFAKNSQPDQHCIGPV